MIFDLHTDLAAALAEMPQKHELRRKIELIQQAVGFDVHFLSRHPTALFQSLWNLCWWYDCPEAAHHFGKPKGRTAQPPWKRPGRKLNDWMEAWCKGKASVCPDFNWLRSLRPPATPLGSAQWMLLSGHTEAVTSVAITPDCSRIVSGSDDKTVRVWDGHTGQAIGEPLTGHVEAVTSVAITPDCSRIVSGSYDGTVRLWDGRTGQAIGEPLIGHTEGVKSVAITPDGSRIVAGSRDHTVRLWDGRTGQAIGEPLTGHTGWVTSVVITPDGSRIVSGSYDNTVRLWDGHTGKCLKVLEGIMSADIRSFLPIEELPAPRHLIAGTVETRLESADAMAVAWFPDQLRKIAAAASGRSWAGSGGKHVYILEWTTGLTEQIKHPAAK